MLLKINILRNLKYVLNKFIYEILRDTFGLIILDA